MERAIKKYTIPESFKVDEGILINRNLIKSFHDFLEKIKDIREAWKKEQIWFRGVSNYKHSLLPGLYRKEKPEDRVKFETNLRVRFRQRYKMLSEFRYITDPWDEYILMQHYGLPTRLLDWTRNALMALFFAVINEKKDSPVVWMIHPTSLNKKYHESGGIPLTNKKSKKLKKYLKLSGGKSDDKPIWPYAIIPTYNNVRINAQSGYFTLHGLDKTPIESLMKDNDYPLIARLKIDERKVGIIKKEILDNNLLTFSKVYPDMQGIVLELKHEFDLKYEGDLPTHLV